MIYNKQDILVDYIKTLPSVISSNINILNEIFSDESAYGTNNAIIVTFAGAERLKGTNDKQISIETHQYMQFRYNILYVFKLLNKGISIRPNIDLFLNEFNSNKLKIKVIRSDFLKIDSVNLPTSNSDSHVIYQIGISINSII
jgi:hypothetical protein